MRRPTPGLLLAGLILGTAPPAACAAEAPDPAALAVRIDEHINRKLKAAGIAPTARAGDAEFLRRVTLDLVGRIPTAHEVHTFVADADPDKRRKVVDRLLKTAAHINHFGNAWRALLLPEASASFEGRYFQPAIEAWVRRHLREGTPYDKMVYELITTPIPADRNSMGRVNYFDGQPNAIGFFAAKEGKPENLAAATARTFLGVQIECAQCHDHPFARWSRDQFWGLAAFFGGIERQGDNVFGPLREVVDRRELAIPNSDKVVQAGFLDDKEPEFKFRTSSRIALADWMTAGDNPFFARTAANRTWAHFFGAGIVDPVDDFNEVNKPTHPELLDELARAFVDAKFDMQFLLRAVVLSEAYQRTSAVTEPAQNDPRLYARGPVKALTPEQLFDSLSTATGFRDNRFNRGPFDFDPNGARNQFLDRFAVAGKKTEPQTSILQALALMNGRFIADATSVERSETLASVASAPFFSTEERIEALFLATVSRKPTSEEMRKLVKHLMADGEAGVKKRLGDVMWVLLNSAEFRWNH
jgi:hypothetical protein